MDALLGALLGFVIGQVVKFIVEPVHKLRDTIGRADFLLGYYSDVYTNPRGSSEAHPTEAQERLRTVAFELREKAAALIRLDLFAKLKLTPDEKSIYKASWDFIELSNSLQCPAPLLPSYRESNRERRDGIVQALGLHNGESANNTRIDTA
jgi:hypothetical protein